MNSSAVKNVSAYACEIKKVPQLKTETKSFFGKGKRSFSVDHYIYIRILDDNSTMTFQVGGNDPSWTHNWWEDVDSFSYGKYSIYRHTVKYYFHASYSGSGCNGGEGSITVANHSTHLPGACSAGGWQYTSVSWDWEIDFLVDRISVSETGSCNPDPDCKLKEEQICDLSGNCVYTIRGFASTGVKPLPQRIKLTSTATGYEWTVYADGNSFTAVNQNGYSEEVKKGENSWFWIKRTYECKEDNQYEFDPKRTQTVLESANPDTGDYQDTLGEGHIPLDNLRTEHEDCPIACIVKIPKNAGTVYSDETTKNTTTYQREVRACEKDESGNYHCPVSTGEEIEQDCGCVDGFGLAATTLQAIHQASKDLICSSSPP
jgi:hypothetical protein